MTIHPQPDSHCPWCNRLVTRTSNANQNETVAPVDGDATLCFYCGEWAIIDLSLPNWQRKPTEAEFIEIGEDPDCQKARAGWVHFKEHGNDGRPYRR